MPQAQLDKQSKLSTRDLILDAAIERFRHYGYTKTAMAEIASDVSMSTANLYRYFENKEDIAVECAKRCLHERHDRLDNIVYASALPADKKLEGFFMEILQYTHEQVSSNPKINELVVVITEKHHEVVHEKNKIEQALIKRIIEQGVSENLFSVDDLDDATIGIHTALHLFQFPISMSIYTLETFREMALKTTHLLLNGLYKR